jgi:hypothetical protein
MRHTERELEEHYAQRTVCIYRDSDSSGAKSLKKATFKQNVDK